MSDKKYTSPEHAIRNIMELKSVGHNVPTDKAFFKPIGVISPPKGDEHVDGSEKIRASRNVAKERQSETMKEALAPKKGETQADLGYDPAGDMTPEEKTRRDAAKIKANKEALKTAKFDSSKPGFYSRDVPPTEKLKDVIQDTLAKSPVYKDIAQQKANDLSNIASSIPFASAVGKAIDSAFYSGKAQPNIIGKGQYLAAKGKLSAPDNKTNFEKDVAAYKAAGSQKLATEKGKAAVVDAATQVIAGKVLGSLVGTEGGGAVSAAVKDIKPPGYFGPQKIKTPEVGKPPATTTPPKTGGSGPAALKTPKIEIPKTVNQTISDIMKRPDLEGSAGNVNKPKSPNLQSPKPEKIEPLPQTGSKGKKAETETPELQTQGSLALKPKQAETPSAPPEKKIKFDKSGQDVVPAKAPPATKPYEPKKMTPDEIAKEMDKFKRQQAPVTEPPSKQSINPKEFYGKPAPESIKPPANVDKKIPAAAPQKAAAPAPQKAAAPAPQKAAAPAAAAAAATAPKLAPAAAAAAAATAPKLAPAPAPAAKPAEKPQQRPNKGRRGGRFPFALPGLTPGQSVGFHQDSNVPVDIYKHVPKEYMTFEQTRYDIENVARPNSKDKTKVRSRQAEIIRKIIEEKKASKKNSTVIINPELKQQEPEQTK